MYLNVFAETTQKLDMTQTDEFRLLLASAADLGIPHQAAVPTWSCNIVLRQHRFHFLEWGEPDAPPILLLHVRPSIGAFVGFGEPESGAPLSSAGARPTRPR